MKKVFLFFLLALLSANTLIALKIFAWRYPLDKLAAKLEYQVTLTMDAVLHSSPVNIETAMPASGSHQKIRNENFNYSGEFTFKTRTSSDGSRFGVWRAEKLDGRHFISYTFYADIRETTFDIPQNLAVSDIYPREVAGYVEPSENIQSDHPDITSLAEKIAGKNNGNTYGIIKDTYDYCLTGIKPADYKGVTDALTTCRLGEGSCNGKSRLFAALMRSSGIPARLVNGIILNAGTKKTTHAWVELWLNGNWVPFDTLNGHFAEKPQNYLILHYGDAPLFTRTSDIKFDYFYKIKKWRTAPEDLVLDGSMMPLSTYPFWDVFRRAHITLNLLKIILLLPLGVLVVIFFRNIIGVSTFGTFMPALMAVAFRDTGLLWGIVLFVIIIGIGSLLRVMLDRIRLLHTPRIAIILTTVVCAILFLTYIAIRLNILDPAYVSMFPIVILTLTVERFFIITQERGLKSALKICALTIAITSAAYVIMESFIVQTLIFAFPEILLVIFALFFVIGRWTGMRLLEYSRFKVLLEV